MCVCACVCLCVFLGSKQTLGSQFLFLEMQEEAARTKQDQNASGGAELVASSFCVHFVFVLVAQW